MGTQSEISFVIFVCWRLVCRFPSVLQVLSVALGSQSWPPPSLSAFTDYSCWLLSVSAFFQIWHLRTTGHPGRPEMRLLVSCAPRVFCSLRFILGCCFLVSGTFILFVTSVKVLQKVHRTVGSKQFVFVQKFLKYMHVDIFRSSWKCALWKKLCMNFNLCASTYTYFLIAFLLNSLKCLIINCCFSKYVVWLMQIFTHSVFSTVVSSITDVGLLLNSRALCSQFMISFLQPGVDGAGGVGGTPVWLGKVTFDWGLSEIRMFP